MLALTCRSPRRLSHGAHASQPARTKANSRSTHACAAVIVVGHQSCFALKRDGLHSILASASPDAIPAGVGYGPSQLQSAYNLTSASAANGAGRTIAIVDALRRPDRRGRPGHLPLVRRACPPCPASRRSTRTAQTSPLPATAPASDDWTLEESLDLDMASAICPLCNIVLVEATDDSGTGLYVAENAAASVAGYISNSWGGTESSSDTTLDSSYFNHPGDVITASAGDSDFGVIYPATSPNVVSVGGTSAEHGLELARLDRVGVEHLSRFRGDRVGLLGRRAAAVLADRARPDRLLQADRQRRRRGRRPGHRGRGLRHLQRQRRVERGRRHQRLLADARRHVRPRPATPAPPRPTTSTPTPATSSTSPPAMTARAARPTCAPRRPATTARPASAPRTASPAWSAGASTGNTVTVTNPGNQTGTVGTAVSLQIQRHRLRVRPDPDLRATGLPGGPVDQLHPA